jgi:competence protein ComEA
MAHARFGAAMILALAAACAAATAAPARVGGSAAQSAKGAGASGADQTARTAPVDINTADVDRLTELPGIGRAIAQRIVDYRKEHGPFKAVEELLNVRGIGDRSLARIRDRVTVGGKG